MGGSKSLVANRSGIGASLRCTGGRVLVPPRSLALRSGRLLSLSIPIGLGCHIPTLLALSTGSFTSCTGLGLLVIAFDHLERSLVLRDIFSTLPLLCKQLLDSLFFLFKLAKSHDLTVGLSITLGIRLVVGSERIRACRGSVGLGRIDAFDSQSPGQRFVQPSRPSMISSSSTPLP
ncbi:hypothetical protein N7513_013411 [Penicillium frequentans]|nr:hypothetical protein N7513_013411 [Penicillium glabrum]